MKLMNLGNSGPPNIYCIQQMILVYHFQHKFQLDNKQVIHLE